MAHNICPFSRQPCTSTCVMFIKQDVNGDPVCALAQIGVELTYFRASWEDWKKNHS